MTGDYQETCPLCGCYKTICLCRNLPEQEMVEKFIKASNEIYRKTKKQANCIWASEEVLQQLLPPAEYHQVMTDLWSKGKVELTMKNGEILTVILIK